MDQTTHPMSFLAKIIRSMGSPEPAPALRKALEEIVASADETNAAEFLQFSAFMREAAKDWRVLPDKIEQPVSSAMLDLILRLAESIPSLDPKNLPDWIRACPALLEIYREHHIARRWRLDSELNLLVRKGENVILSGPAGQTLTVKNVLPGHYSLILETGRLLWQGILSEHDLIWSKAYAGRPLRLAADSGDRTSFPTKEEILLNGELYLRVFAGIRAGLMEISGRGA